MDYTVGVFQDSFELGNLTGTRSKFQLTSLFWRQLNWSSVFQWTLRNNWTRLSLMLPCENSRWKECFRVGLIGFKRGINIFRGIWVNTSASRSYVLFYYLPPIVSFLLTQGKFLMYAHIWSDTSGILCNQQILERLKFDLRNVPLISRSMVQALSRFMRVRLVSLNSFSYTLVKVGGKTALARSFTRRKNCLPSEVTLIWGRVS